MTSPSIEISIPEGVSARLALEWVVERLIRMIDALDEVEDRERSHDDTPPTCSLVISAIPSEIHGYAIGEEIFDGF